MHQRVKVAVWRWARWRSRGDQAVGKVVIMAVDQEGLRASDKCFALAYMMAKMMATVSRGMWIMRSITSGRT